MLHLISDLRETTKLSQKQFALKYGIPLSTLRKWEQGDSRPPSYLVRLIENSLPCYKNYESYIGDDGKTYYLDKENSRIGDAQGNWIKFDVDIQGVIETNIPLYIQRAFEKYYEAVEQFNNSLKYDKIEKIKWR